MKMGIISDTHNNLPAIGDAVEIFNREEASVIIHAGDWNAPFSLAKLATTRTKITGVFGNVDGEREYLKTKAKEQGAQLLGDFGEIEIDGIKIAIIHGKDEPNVAALSKSSQYDVVIRGHTHKPDVTASGSMLVINPWDACGYRKTKRTVALLDTTNMKVKIMEF